MTLKQVTSSAGAILLLGCLSLTAGIASADMVADGKTVAFLAIEGDFLAVGDHVGAGNPGSQGEAAEQ